MTRHRTAAGMVALAVVLWSEAAGRAHSGPPFPILSNRTAGAYEISIWTDPDSTDDGSAAGQFWVVLGAAGGGAAVPAGTEVTVSIRPLDREGPTRTGRADPVNGAFGNQFVALLMDHEGPFAVHVAIAGPLGRAEADGQVEATYDQRPAPGLIALYLLPFLAVGALWVKVLLRRRQAGNHAPASRTPGSGA